MVSSINWEEIVADIKAGLSIELPPLEREFPDEWDEGLREGDQPLFYPDEAEAEDRVRHEAIVLQALGVKYR